MINIFIALLALIAAGLIFRTNARKHEINEKTKFGFFVPHKKPAQENLEPEATPTVNAANLDYTEINRSWRIADMHFARGNFAQAEKWLIIVIASNATHTEALNCLGVIYIHQNNPRRAELIFKKILSITQKEPVYYVNFGRCLYNQGRTSEAIEAYENAIKLDSMRPTRFVSVGQIYYEQKNFQKALDYFVRALELDPNNFEYLSITAQLAETVGDTDRLHKSLKKTLEIDPYNEQVKAKLATIQKD